MTVGRWWRAAVVVVAAVLLLVSFRAVTARDTPAARATPPAPIAGCLAVGAAVGLPGRSDGPGLPLFRRAEATLGPLTIRRSFDASLPKSFATSAAAGDAAAGLRSFVSWKPPHGDFLGATRGRYDRQIRAWAASVPRTGVYATAFHEPENDMTAAEFVAFQRHVYPVVKRANPTIQWGAVYMAYWWEPGRPGHVSDPAAWWPGDRYADFAGLDWYGVEPGPMTRSASFAAWYAAMAPTGLPLVIPEYGQYLLPPGQHPVPAQQQARAAAIAEDAAWLRAHPRFRVWMYWQGVTGDGSWRLTDAVSTEAWREAAQAGCRR